MGACDFYHVGKGSSAKEAFNSAVEEACHDYGHAGYTGTLAEKSEFVMIKVPAGKDPEEYAEHLMEEGDDRIDDKWGPAGCVELGDNKYLFFGWASS